MGLKLAVITDDGLVQRFALDALDAVEGTDEVTIFSCTNTRTRKRWLRHAAYYGLNLRTVRNRLTRYVPITSGQKTVSSETRFESVSEGAWQELPHDIVQALKAGGFDVVLKFGMGLLRVPPPEELPVPILSYHHGDPDHYRGRPAGFWEMNEGRPVMGQVVQVIGNRLDAGKVVVFAETKVCPWSYRSTLVEAYRHSPSIINTALRNAMSGTALNKESSGRNCRLPSNLTTVRFVLKTIARSVHRLFYGAFMEKAWRVSTADLGGDAAVDLLTSGRFPATATWQDIPVPKEYAFYADPFFHGDSSVLVEALRAGSGLGEIVRIDEAGHRPVIQAAGHISYPSTCFVDGREIVIPETASWSAPNAYIADGPRLDLLKALRISDGARVTDPTLFAHEGTLYLFGNDRRLGSSVLNLWTSTSLDEEFVLHPDCPIRISPEGARMGGAIGRIHFADRRGPHTLNIRGNRIVFDWYHDRMSPLAGVRRLVALARRQSARRRPTATQ